MIVVPNPMVVDLSSYQNVRDWKKVAATRIKGVINKVTEGATITDRTCDFRVEPTKEHGLLFGVYHFLRPGSMQAQVVHFLEASEYARKVHPDLLLALDHEDDRVSLDEAKTWMMGVHAATGRWPIIYSGHVLKEQLGDRHDPFFDGIRLWLAQYSNDPTVPAMFKKYWLWQYTGDGVGQKPHDVDGIDGTGLDINSYDGSAGQLAREWADG